MLCLFYMEKLQEILYNLIMKSIQKSTAQIYVRSFEI